MEFLKSTKYTNRLTILRAGVELAPTNKDGLWLEFGVCRGNTINFISTLKPDKTIYGFDSFKGIPEDWFGVMKKGFFSTNGKHPLVNKNVILIDGWFKDTLPSFIDDHPQASISFLHIDCDLYSSTKDVLHSLHEKIIRGTVICFDEFYNYEAYKDHEYKAWNEYVKNKGVKYEYIGHTASEQVMLRIK